MRNDTQDSPTAPLPILSQFFTWAPGEEPAPYDPPSTRRHSPPPRRTPDAINIVRRPVLASHNRRQRWLAAGAAAVTIAVATVLLWPEPTTQQSDGAPPSTSTASDAPRLDARLAPLLPPGYPPGTCAALPPTNTTAECGANADAPATSGRYTVYPDADALTDAFNRYVAETTVLVCPGGYQSPGPWRRNAAPSVSVGTLVCGTGPRGLPRIGWTLDSEHLLAAIESDRNGPTLPQLYDWWSTHS